MVKQLIIPSAFLLVYLLDFFDFSFGLDLFGFVCLFFSFKDNKN